MIVSILVGKERLRCGEVGGEMNAIEATQSRVLAMEREMDKLRQGLKQRDGTPRPPLVCSTIFKSF